MTPATLHPRPLTIRSETILRSLLFLMLAVGSISFVEPSPYEFIFLILAPVVFFGHLVLTRVTLALMFLLCAFLGAEVLSLTPYFQDRPAINEDGYGATATVYTLQSIYVFGSALLFAIIFTRQTQPRLRLALIAYTISCAFAAGVAVAVYFDWTDINPNTVDPTRSIGPFKDPNVLGSYTVLGALYLIQVILTTSRMWSRILCLLVLGLLLFGGLFLPLSRGAWGAMAFSLIYFGVVTFWTSNRQMRRKLMVGAAALTALVIAGGVLATLDSDLSESLSRRAKVEQDYDGGTTGRFGNQKRAIPMLIERPLGFGPHRFTWYFDLDPHNSYIGAFSSAGWMGGIAFILLVGSSAFLAIRLSIARTPFLREAQVISPVLLSAFLQAIQIDVDHWRFIHLMIGATWGMEAARQLAARALPAPAPSRIVHRAEGLPAAS